jgi:Fe-S cluster assembly protein SufD
MNSSPEWITQNFRAVEQSGSDDRSSGLQTLRKRAFGDFQRLGFPTAQLEDWRFTNPSPIARQPFTLAKPETLSQARILESDALVPRSIVPNSIVFIDGRFFADRSILPEQKGLTVGMLGDSSVTPELLGRIGTIAPGTEQALIALNTAFLRDAVVIHVARGVKVEEPIHVVFVGGGSTEDALIPARVLVVAEDNSAVTVIESFVGYPRSRYFVNQVTEVVAAQGASVDHYKIQRESETAFHYGAIAATLARDSQFRTHTFSFGGSLVRNEVYPVLAGTGVHALLNGLTVLRDAQHVDNSTTIDHAQPHCESHELYKGVYAGKSTGVFSGTIIVRPDAQKTNALQTNQSLLLSSDASVDSRPQLKIWADDVKCTHGATVGQLDENAMFYLRSRGVREADARNMLIHAFASDVISSVQVAPLRVHLEEALTERLEQIGAL